MFKKFVQYKYEMDIKDLKINGVEGLITNISARYKSNDRNDADYMSVIYTITSEEPSGTKPSQRTHRAGRITPYPPSQSVESFTSGST